MFPGLLVQTQLPDNLVSLLFFFLSRVHQLTQQRCHPQRPSREPSPVEATRVPVGAACVAHVHVSDMVLAMVDEEVIRDHDTRHGTEKDTPTAQHRYECAWVPMTRAPSVEFTICGGAGLQYGLRHVVPRTDGDRYDRQDVAPSSNVDPPSSTCQPTATISRKLRRHSYLGQSAAMSIPVEMPFSI